MKQICGVMMEYRKGNAITHEELGIIMIENKMRKNNLRI